MDGIWKFDSQEQKQKKNLKEKEVYFAEFGRMCSLV